MNIYKFNHQKRGTFEGYILRAEHTLDQNAHPTRKKLTQYRVLDADQKFLKCTAVIDDNVWLNAEYIVNEGLQYKLEDNEF